MNTYARPHLTAITRTPDAVTFSGTLEGQPHAVTFPRPVGLQPFHDLDAGKWSVDVYNSSPRNAGAGFRCLAHFDIPNTPVGRAVLEFILDLPK